MKADSRLVTVVVPSPNRHRPARKRNALLLVHSMETPITQGYADAIARNWFAKASSQVSSQYIVGPQYAIQCVIEADASWNCGPVGNPLTVAFEFCGYASYSRAQWTTAVGKAMIQVGADLMSDRSVAYGGPANPKRATAADLKAYAAGKPMPSGVAWATHADVSKYMGGTTHTDPGGNFPYDLLQAALDGKSKPVTPSASPTIVYTVRQGDSLSKIAAAHASTGATVADLVRWNGITNPNLIRIGQKITIYPKGTPAPSTPAAPPKPAAPSPAPAAAYTPPPGPFGLPAGHYYGLITGPAKSHGGYNASERPAVRWIQIRLQQLGYAPKNAGWADGLFEQPTKDAVAKWQKARHAKTTSRPGEVWADDWTNLTKDR